MQRTQSGVLWLEHLDNKLRLLANLLKLDGLVDIMVECVYFLEISVFGGSSDFTFSAFATSSVSFVKVELFFSFVTSPFSLPPSSCFSTTVTLDCFLLAAR